MADEPDQGQARDPKKNLDSEENEKKKVEVRKVIRKKRLLDGKVKFEISKESLVWILASLVILLYGLSFLI